MQILNSGISVIVCCYNSAARIPETLKYLANQVVPVTLPWEVIVVNNASNDNTTEIVTLEWSKYEFASIKLKIVNEIRAGLSFARQKGAESAIYKYLIFCDDDNWLDEAYILNAFNIMESNPEIGALGGKSTAVTDADHFPEWFESASNGFAVGQQSPYQGDVSKTCLLWGAGMVTRRDLFLNCYDLKYPSVVTDRKGDSLSSGGDTEYCLRILLKGYKLYYNESLTFIHFVTKARWSKEYNEKLGKAKVNGIIDAMALNKYLLLYKLISSKRAYQPLLVVKIYLGYLSSIFLNRRSWCLADAKAILYFYTLIDLGVDRNTKQVLKFYKNL